MSGLIEKITLYDLLGYALPGSILLGASAYICMKFNGSLQSMYSTYKDALGYFFTVLLILGYVTGMLIAEITDWIIHFSKKGLDFDTKQYFRDKNLNYVQIEQTLAKAGYLKNGDKILGEDDLVKYLPSMYGNIQSDAKYNRLHNYASSKLICKNMTFVSWCICATALAFTANNYYGRIFVQDQRFCMVLILKLFGIAVLLAAGLFFKRRWKKMYMKTYFYAVVWFIEKYA